MRNNRSNNRTATSLNSVTATRSINSVVRFHALGYILGSSSTKARSGLWCTRNDWNLFLSVRGLGPRINSLLFVRHGAYAFSRSVCQGNGRNPNEMVACPSCLPRIWMDVQFFTEIKFVPFNRTGPHSPVNDGGRFMVWNKSPKIEQMQWMAHCYRTQGLVARSFVTNGKD